MLHQGSARGSVLRGSPRFANEQLERLEQLVSFVWQIRLDRKRRRRIRLTRRILDGVSDIRPDDLHVWQRFDGVIQCLYPVGDSTERHGVDIAALALQKRKERICPVVVKFGDDVRSARTKVNEISLETDSTFGIFAPITRNSTSSLNRTFAKSPTTSL